MSNPIIASLEENLKYIKLIAGPTTEGFTRDRGNTGDKKEQTVQEFIASYLTNDYQVKKGSISSLQGSSQNIDCVILYPNHPKLSTLMREVIIAEGVYAAIEIKPDISTLTAKSEFHRGLVQIQSVKNIVRKLDLPHLPALGVLRPTEYFHKIPGIIFSFKSQDLLNVVNYMKQCFVDKKFTEEEFPDIIFSLDKGIIFYCPKIKETSFKHVLDTMCNDYPDRVFVVIKETESKLLVWFLRLFFSFHPPTLAMSQSILFKYLELDPNIRLEFYSLDDNDKFVNKPAATPTSKI